MASPDVRSDTTTRGTTPNSDTDARDAPSSTGRRPVRSIEVATRSTEADDEPAAIDAAGSPQSTRTVDANWAAVEAFTNTTLADGPIEVQSEEAAAADPAYVAEAPTPTSRTRLTNFDSPDEYRPTDACGTIPGFSVVTSGGIASASAQQIATSATVRRDAPSSAARRVNRDEAQTANSTSPGSTTGTS